MSVIHVEGKVLGRKRPLFTDWAVPLPPECRGEGGLTLRQLIAQVVRQEVEAFRRRQQQRRLVRVLSPQQIEQGAQQGKIDSGGRQLHQKVDPEEAVATAWEAFQDGIYLVIIDGQQYQDLDQQVFLQPDSRVTFLRLVMLAGG